MADRERIERMIEDGRDSAMLRLAAANACLEQSDPDAALMHLRRAVELDPAYSAAWKAYARTLDSAGQAEAAEQAYLRGIEAAEQRGDRQAAREMQVFLKRIRAR